MKKYLAIILSIAILVCGCKKKKEEEVLFDRELMLKNYAENIILPSYKDVQSATSSLISAINTFDSQKTLMNLELMQEAWIDAYNEWQYSSIFNIGPAAEQGLSKALVEEIATFPISSTKIDNIISSGVYNLNDFNRDARGFLGIEYLIFSGLNISNDSTLTLFQSQPMRMQYLKDCATHIKTKIDYVTSQWEGSYKAEFISNNGTDVGSSTSQLYNAFVKSFETIKNLKIELPMGLRPGQIQVEPHLVESYYSGNSLLFIKTHLKAIENTYHGMSKNQNDGIGFKEYLESVIGGPELVQSTISQWNLVLSSVENISTTTPLSQQIISNPQPIENFRIELQKHTRFFKSDMSSLLGIAITYSSGDGD